MKKMTAWVLSLALMLCMAGAQAEAGESIFLQLAGLEWTFSSGAGGWYVDIRMAEDGSFEGDFHDSEMGDSGEGYPYGTMYIGTFHGQMSEAESTEENVRKLRVDLLEMNEEVGEEKIEDGIRYKYAEAYGLSEGDVMDLYAPGTAVDALPEDMVIWTHVMDEENPPTELETWFLCSSRNQSGFIGYMISDEVPEEASGEEAEEFPQPEGGKKFDTNWALRGMLTEIYFEEEGYRVAVKEYSPDTQSGTDWEYSCFYNEEQDALVSVSSLKTVYHVDPETMEASDYETVYEGLDEEGTETVFTINENGMLIWQDGRGTDGADLEFQNIGRFAGVYLNETEQVKVEIEWMGLDQESFYYNVGVRRGEGKLYTIMSLTGDYMAEVGRLVCEGHIVTWTENAEGGYDSDGEGEACDAYFKMMKNGNLFYETANGIELENITDSE